MLIVHCVGSMYYHTITDIVLTYNRYTLTQTDALVQNTHTLRTCRPISFPSLKATSPFSGNT